MLYTLFQRPFSTLFVCFGLHKYLSCNYPKQYEYFCIQFGYYVVYYYSKVQLLYFKIHPHIMRQVEKIVQTDFFQKIFPKKNEEPNGVFEFIKDGNVLYSCLKEHENNSVVTLKDFDFIIYSKLDQDKNSINKKIFFEFPVKNDNVEKTDYYFMLTEITICEEVIQLHLNTNKSNYFIVNNIIDSKFLLYLLKTREPWIFEKYTLEEIKNYKLKIIDHSVCLKEIDNNSKLILYKNNYEISIP